jgi:hypothetical protein
MKQIHCIFLLFIALAWLLSPASSPAQATDQISSNSATNPLPRDPKWVARHEGFVTQAKQGNIDLLFLGDSITDFWRNRGSNVWNQFYAPLYAANFGISADRT